MGKKFPELLQRYMATSGIHGPGELARRIGVDNSYGTRLLNNDKLRGVSPPIAESLIKTLAVPENLRLEFLLQAAGYNDKLVEQLLRRAGASKISPDSSDATIVLQKKAGRWRLLKP